VQRGAGIPCYALYETVCSGSFSMHGTNPRIVDVRSPRRVLARLQLIALLVAAFVAAPWLAAQLCARSPRTAPAGDIVGSVVDSSSAQPLASAEVSLRRGTSIVARTTTDAFGHFVFHNMPSGPYSVTVQSVGFSIAKRTVNVPPSGNAQVAFHLNSVPFNIAAVEVTAAAAPVAVDTRTGDQTYTQEKAVVAPTATTSQILQQSIAGAVRAPTGEVHIRGQHAEYTYYVDGVPVPPGISGSLNELFDPSIVNRIDFKTGAWDAEFGNKNTAIVDVTTRIPAGGFHVNASTYGGSFATNGQSLAMSTNSGHWGVFLSGARQASDMRLEPVIIDTHTNEPINFHNHGEDLFGFGKVQYTPSQNDVMILDANLSRTRLGIPFDSTGGTSLDDHQTDINAFVNLGWRHSFGSAAEFASAASELFTGAFFRHGSLNYEPGPSDDPQFVFFPDTLTPYNLTEDRNFNTVGGKIDYTHRFSHDFEFKLGTLASKTFGHEDFVTVDANGRQGPASNSDLKGSDVGVYAQTAISPAEMIELRAGVRYDSHVAPFAGNQHQLSPRVKLSFFPAPSTTIYFYYGRLFVPTNVEDLRAITSVAQEGVTTQPTLPERDHFFEVGITHRFPYGIATKFSGYRKLSHPGIDDNTVPGSQIVTSVNIDSVWVNGLEGVLEFRPDAPFSGFLNAALSHAYGVGPITGGFFPTDTPEGTFDLDHDQRLSITGGLSYALSRFNVSATGIYGSGLTNGVDPADCGCAYGTGLFDFNKGIKVDPNFIVNANAGFMITSGRGVIRPQVFVDNLFNKHYLLKGAFFSGPVAGRPRSIQVRVNIQY
jgi:hypothetical protein